MESTIQKKITWIVGYITMVTPGSPKKQIWKVQSKQNNQTKTFVRPWFADTQWLRLGPPGNNPYP